MSVPTESVSRQRAVHRRGVMALLWSITMVRAYQVHRTPASSNTYQNTQPYRAIPQHHAWREHGSRRNRWSMDVERPSIQDDRKYVQRLNHVLQYWNGSPSSHTPSRGGTSTLSKSETAGALHEQSAHASATSHGMPWRSSIDGSYSHEQLFYMPFWEWQVEFMKSTLTNFRGLPVRSRSGRDMSYVESGTSVPTRSSGKPMRMHTCCFASDEYKQIRLTTLDAGPRTQVFTSLWYPNPEYDLPVLGIDLLQFNEKKHLCVVDFQPLHTSENDHTVDRRHVEPRQETLASIRSQYPSLQGSMTKRFYDETQFFSSQMLLARDPPDGSDPTRMVNDELFPAYQRYVETHVEMVQSATPDPSTVPTVLDRHAAYDEYSAARDPAHALLARAFGQDWADEYVYDVLFPLSQK